MSGLFHPNDPALRGGVPLKRVPVIPWDAFVACGLRVYRDGKVKTMAFVPEPIESPDEALAVMRLLVAAQANKPGPVAWDTVPEEVQRHFREIEVKPQGQLP